MFIDVAKIKIRAGSGGDGAVSFHREKYVNAGGPNGGDGGRGGNIMFVADTNLSTLMDFRYKRKYKAKDGDPGGIKNCSGRMAENSIIKVPVGTLVKEANTGMLIADITSSEPVIIAKGGRGGWGNQHYATPTRQIPRFAKPGAEGESLDILLELKLIADVGLIGFPNVGKSTIISVISAAKPKIANYHFTTLSPVLGVVRVDDEASFVAADIPGIIEGASDGLGLGHAFLRHVERCRMLLHVVDVSGCEGRDPKEDFEKINTELVNFSEPLSHCPQIVLGNKCDIATPEQVEDFKQYIESKGYEFMPVSAATRQGLQPLPAKVYGVLQTLPKVKVFEPDYVKPVANINKRTFKIIKLDENVFEVEADWLVKILESCDVDDYESLQFFQNQLKMAGILDKLVEMGVQEEDTICIEDYQFDYIF